jgi:hypothetical protein
MSTIFIHLNEIFIDHLTYAKNPAGTMNMTEKFNSC